MWNHVAQTTGACAYVLLQLFLLALIIWGCRRTHFKGMMWLAGWFVWAYLMGWAIGLALPYLLERWVSAGGALPTGMTIGSALDTVHYARSIVGAALLATALLILIGEIEELREARNASETAEPPDRRPA